MTGPPGSGTAGGEPGGARAELRAVARSTGQGIQAVNRTARDMHASIGAHVWAALGPRGRPVSGVQEPLARGVFATVDRGAGLLGMVAGAVLEQAVPDDRPSLHDQPRSARVLGWLAAAAGPTWEAESSPLAPTMSVRRDGRAVPLTGPAIAAAYRPASSRLLVFVHGLTGTEHDWGPEQDSLDALAADVGMTAVAVRYNTGLPVAENGRRLDELLYDLGAAWPVPTTSLALVAHSMGGLVVRAALASERRGARTWQRLVDRVVYLGTPHRGAPLARASGATTSLLRRWPTTAPLGDLVSGGLTSVRDLERGRPGRTGHDEAGARGYEEHSIAATVPDRVTGVPARLIGDLLVTPGSASAEGDAAVRGGLNHWQLLTHPDVRQDLRDLLST